MPIASIIIATKNRAESTRQTLAAIETIDLPPGGDVELIVADNGSTDATADVVLGHKSDKFEVRYLLEKGRGKSMALNRAIREARGEYLVFTDDDTLPCREWLTEHVSAYADPEIGAVQGRIEAVYVGELPVWSESGDFSTHFGDAAVKPFVPDLVGANMSMRSAVPKKIGGYDIRLGPGRCGYFEDSEYSQRLKRAGFIQAYRPGAMVKHVINVDRLAEPVLLKTMFQFGVSSYVADNYGQSGSFYPQFAKFLRSSLGVAKFRVKRWLTRKWPRITHVDLFYEMERGSMWARLQGRRKLERLYELPGDAGIGPIS